MKIKTLAVGSLLIVSTVASSVALAMNHYKISFQSFSTNSTLNTLKPGYKAELTYYLNPIFYLKGNVALYPGNVFGEEGKVGAQQQFGALKVYVEGGYERKPANNHYKNEFVYDVGTSYHLFKYFSPTVELDNFATRDSRAIKLGGEVPITGRFSVAADYIQDIGRKGNGAELKLNYAF